MLFWTRAFICIGTVTVMAVGHLPAGPPPVSVSDTAPSATTLVGEACRARPDLCAAAVTGGLDAAMRAPERPRVSPRMLRRTGRHGDPVALAVRSLT